MADFIRSDDNHGGGNHASKGASSGRGGGLLETRTLSVHAGVKYYLEKKRGTVERGHNGPNESSGPAPHL